MSIITSSKKISKNELQIINDWKLCIVTSLLNSSAGTNNKVYLTLTPLPDFAYEYYCTLDYADRLGEEYCCDILTRNAQTRLAPSMSIETGSDGLLVDSIGYYRWNYNTNEYEKFFKYTFMQSNSYIKTEGTDTCLKDSFWVDSDSPGCKKVRIYDSFYAAGVMECVTKA